MYMHMSKHFANPAPMTYELDTKPSSNSDKWAPTYSTIGHCDLHSKKEKNWRYGYHMSATDSFHTLQAEVTSTPWKVTCHFIVILW